MNSKLRVNANNLNKVQNQLDRSNELSLKLKKDLQNLEEAFRGFTIDNQAMNDELNKEHAMKENEEKNNNQLRIILADRKNKLHCLNDDYIYLKNLHGQKCEERNMLQMETDKLRQHIMTLTKQNERLSDEIDAVIKDDNQMKDILNRSDRMSTMLKTNDSIICQMPKELINESNCFDKSQMCEDNRIGLNQSGERQRSLSPNFTYSRIQKNL